jgi:hypothetical protein
MALVWVSNSSEPQTVKWGANRKMLDHTTAVGAVKTTTIVSEEYTSCMHVPPIAARTTPFANLSTHSLRCGHDHEHWSDSCYFDTTAPELYLDPGFIHTAVLTPLPPPGHPVYYSFGATVAFGGGGADDRADPTARSATYSFVSPRPPGDHTAFSFLYTADAGIGAVPPDEAGGATHNDEPVNGADSVFDAIAADASAHVSDEFVILNGDISYARGWPFIWERFFDLVQPLTTRMPMMTGVGNHEIDTAANALSLARGHDSGGECGVQTLKRFPHYENGLGEMYYSFDYGSVHAVMLSSEHPAEDQLAFFNSDMAALNRTQTPWIIVMLHRPLFGSDPRDAIDLELAENWHSIFVQNGVDMVLSGHQHFYERLCAVETQLGCTTNGRDRPIYIIDGSAGAEFNPAVDPHRPSNISLHREFSRWGYSRVSVAEESLTFTHYHTDNTVADSVSLPKREYLNRVPVA